MNVKTKSMLFEYGENSTRITIDGKEPFYCTGRGLALFRRLPEMLSEVAKDEEEYDKLFLEVREVLGKFLHDEAAINEIVDKIMLKLGGENV